MRRERQEEPSVSQDKGFNRGVQSMLWKLREDALTQPRWLGKANPRPCLKSLVESGQGEELGSPWVHGEGFQAEATMCFLQSRESNATSM